MTSALPKVKSFFKSKKSPSTPAPPPLRIHEEPVSAADEYNAPPVPQVPEVAHGDMSTFKGKGKAKARGPTTIPNPSRPATNSNAKSRGPTRKPKTKASAFDASRYASQAKMLLNQGQKLQDHLKNGQNYYLTYKSHLNWAVSLLTQVAQDHPHPIDDEAAEALLLDIRNFLFVNSYVGSGPFIERVEATNRLFAGILELLPEKPQQNAWGKRSKGKMSTEELVFMGMT